MTQISIYTTEQTEELFCERQRENTKSHNNFIFIQNVDTN